MLSRRGVRGPDVGEPGQWGEPTTRPPACDNQRAATHPHMCLERGPIVLERGAVIEGGWDVLPVQEPPRSECLWVAVAVGRRSSCGPMYRPPDASCVAELVLPDPVSRRLLHGSAKACGDGAERNGADHASHDNEQHVDAQSEKETCQARTNCTRQITESATHRRGTRDVTGHSDTRRGHMALLRDNDESALVEVLQESRRFPPAGVWVDIELLEESIAQHIHPHR